MLIVAVEVVFEEGEIDREGVRESFRVMDRASQNEQGCLKYTSSIDINNSTIIRIDEMWESMEALTAHFQEPHMATFQAALGAVKTKSMKAHVYAISKELPFPH